MKDERTPAQRHYDERRQAYEHQRRAIQDAGRGLMPSWEELHGPRRAGSVAHGRYDATTTPSARAWNHHNQ